MKYFLNFILFEKDEFNLKNIFEIDDIILVILIELIFYN